MYKIFSPYKLKGLLIKSMNLLRGRHGHGGIYRKIVRAGYENIFDQSPWSRYTLSDHIKSSFAFFDIEGDGDSELLASDRNNRNFLPCRAKIVFLGHRNTGVSLLYGRRVVMAWAGTRMQTWIGL